MLPRRAGIDERAVDIPEKKAFCGHDEAHTLGRIERSQIRISCAECAFRIAKQCKTGAFSNYL
jgi:hypothetical protein